MPVIFVCYGNYTWKTLKTKKCRLPGIICFSELIFDWHIEENDTNTCTMAFSRFPSFFSIVIPMVNRRDWRYPKLRAMNTLPFCHTVTFSACHALIKPQAFSQPYSVPHSQSHRVTLSNCHCVTLSLCHTLTVSHCHCVTLSLCHTFILSHCHCVTPSGCHTVILSH